MITPYFEQESQRKRMILDGERLIVPPTVQSLELVNQIQQLVQLKFAREDIQTVHRTTEPEHFFKIIGSLRRTLYFDEALRALTFELFEDLGFKKEHIAFDPFRLRAITPLGHLNPAAASVYFPHRDTWYAHPQSILVLWMPLHDVTKEETFVFYPDYFAKAVPNNSEVFNYDQWIKDGPDLKIGWQQKEAGLEAVYPRSEVGFNAGESVGFSCTRASHLLFSGSHYHGTLPLAGDKTRFSIDIRFVHLNDIDKKIEAPNSDNRSKGCTIKDFIFWKA